MNSRIKVFLCHANEDKDLVTKVYHRLKKDGFKPWLDKEDLLLGQSWDKVIPKVIDESDFIIIFLSTHSVSKRGYVQKEFKLALDVLDQMPEDQVFIIPVKLDDCPIPEKFKFLQWANLYEKDGYDKILKSLKQHRPAFT